jgi:hypothetical protein
MYDFILYCLVSPDMFSRLESGAIYCIAAIFLVITVSLHDPEIFNIGIGIGLGIELGIGEQLIVSTGHSHLS